MYDMQVVACKENLIYTIYMLLSVLACHSYNECQLIYLHALACI